MSSTLDDAKQEVGEPVVDWTPRERPSTQEMLGRFCRLRALDADRDAADLWAAFAQNSSGSNWTYLPYGPFDRADSLKSWLAQHAGCDDPVFYTVVDSATGRAVGVASYLRIEPAVGVIEVGHIHFADCLQRTPLATEAMYLMMRHVFAELGYRRYEWKCNALNEPSCRAALRLGFQFEGIFRQATIVKNRNRDTAWYAAIDSDWPEIERGFKRWLAADNFDAQGQQLRRLLDCSTLAE